MIKSLPINLQEFMTLCFRKHSAPSIPAADPGRVPASIGLIKKLSLHRSGPILDLAPLLVNGYEDWLSVLVGLLQGHLQDHTVGSDWTGQAGPGYFQARRGPV